MRRMLATGRALQRFFEGLVQHAFFQELGVGDTRLVDYLSDLLCRFVRMDAVFGLRDVQGRRLEEVAEMLTAADSHAVPNLPTHLRLSPKVHTTAGSVLGQRRFRHLWIMRMHPILGRVMIKRRNGRTLPKSGARLATHHFACVGRSSNETDLLVAVAEQAQH